MAQSEMDISRVVRTLLAYQGRSRANLAQYLGVHVSAVNKALADPPRRNCRMVIAQMVSCADNERPTVVSRQTLDVAYATLDTLDGLTK